MIGNILSVKNNQNNGNTWLILRINIWQIIIICVQNLTEIFLFSNLSTEIQAIPVLKANAKTQSIGHQPTTEYPPEFS